MIPMPLARRPPTDTPGWSTWCSRRSRPRTNTAWACVYRGEQAQFPCVAVVARSSGGSDVHLFFVKGQGATTDSGVDPVSLQYRYGTLG